MKASTVAALDRINRRFYEDQACEFDQTRQGPWMGWKRVVDAVRDHLSEKRPFAVLDVGCGNGRFGRFLARELPGLAINWAGIDASEPLLESFDLTGLRSEFKAVTQTWQLLGTDGSGPRALPQPIVLWGDREVGHDLTVAFGLFHHIPGPLQAPLLSRMLETTRPGGFVVASFWQFADLAHYSKRRVSWDIAEARGWIGANDRAALDDDDWLLRWGHDESLAARYCRATNVNTARTLVARCVAHDDDVSWFRADGRSEELNLYTVIRRT